MIQEDEADVYDIRIKQGETWILPMILTDTNGDPIDVTGAVLAGQVREVQSTEAKLLAEMSFSVTEGPAGKFTAYIDDSITATMDRDGYYDIWVHGVVSPRRMLQGRAMLDRAVTVW